MTRIDGSRVRYARSAEMTDAYDVLIQDRPRARWRRAGIVARYGSAQVGYSWNSLGDGAPEWGPWRRTRADACADMLAGITGSAYAAAR